VIKPLFVVCLLTLSCSSLLQGQEVDPHATHVVDEQIEVDPSEDKLSADPHAGHDMGGSQSDHAEHNMTLDRDGMVMNSNRQTLPQDCTKLAAEYNFEVYAGTEFASDYPGTVYGMSQHEYLVEPCSSVTVKFINNDDVRHQWMIHGLPRYLYPGGMFHLEAAGGQSREGTFIIPSDNKTYLVHCDMAKHMEMGMKGQLKAGKGSGDLWSIPGVSRSFRPDIYLPEFSRNYMLIALLGGVLLALLIPIFWRRH
jgi:hypothetical protein